MAALTSVIRRLRALFRRSQIDRDLEDEMRLHVELLEQQLQHDGISAADAATAARRRFGNTRRLREDGVDSWGWRWLDQLGQDIRFAVRTLIARPTFTVTAVLTLGLGIGANTAMFSALNGIVLKPLPYANGDRLVVIQQSIPGRQVANAGVSVREFYDYRDRATSFDAVVEYHQMFFDLLRRGDPDRVDVGVVSHDFFAVLGIEPMLGRSFRPSDDARGADAVLILGYSYWMEKFGGDPAIVGQVFEMNDRPHTVVGVLPDVPHYPQENDVYMPVASCPFRAAADDPAQGRRAFSILSGFGRLKPGVTQAEAEREVDVLCRRSNAEHPDAYPDGQQLTALAPTVRAALVRNARPLLMLLLGTTGLVLLIACANVANLAIARLLRRDRELGLREALGAGRGRLVRQLLTESTLLSIVAGAAGLVFGAAIVSLLAAFAAPLTPRATEIAIDGRVLAFTTVVSIATGLLFGTAPALMSRIDLGALMRAGRAAETPLGRRLQRGLMIAQVAVAVVLLAGAGLLLTSFYRLQQLDLGFRPERVVTAQAFMTFSRYSTREAYLRVYESVVERLEAQPGVLTAAVTNNVPLGPVQTMVGLPFRVEGHAADETTRGGANLGIVTPRYFEALEIPIVNGRGFTAADDDAAPLVAVVSQTLARQFGERSIVGARLWVGQRLEPRTIIGVAGDVKQMALDRHGVPQIYETLRQAEPAINAQILVRTTRTPAETSTMITQAVHAVDPDMPVENIATLDELRGSHLSRPQLTAVLLTLFAGLALVVTLTGIAGVMAMHVSHRLKEFGVRTALGATRSQVLGPVLGAGLSLVALGLALGLAAAALLTRVLSPYLFDTTPTDPAAFGAVAIALLLTGAAACVGPAWSATRVDPQVVFRTD